MEIVSTTTGQIIVSVFLVINLLAFFVMGRDKKKSYSDKHIRRIPEGLIFFMATMFGSVGVYLGMLTFRHKTKKWYFKIGVPMLIVQNAATVYLVFELATAL